MKKTFASGLRTLVALFVLLGGLFIASEATAQSALSGAQQTANLNWVTPQQAVNVAKQQVEFWHTQGPFAPGTTNYNNWLRHAAFYKSIMYLVENGSTVPSAIEASLGQVATIGGEKEAEFTPKTVINAFREEAIELLTF